MSKPILFASSVVGSLPRPAFVLDLINDRPPLPPDRYAREMQTAVRYAVAMQEHAGMDVVTDGEWWRKSYIGVIAELAHGFELGTAPDGRPWTVVVDKLSPKKPGFIAQEAKFLKSITTRQIKSTLPSPALLGERMWHAEKSAKAYPKRDDFVRACVPILRRELELVRDASADIVQIDDPHLCLFVDPDVRSRYTDPDGAAAFAADMVNEVVNGVTGIKIAVHLCRRAGARVRGEHSHGGGYGPILPYLNRLKVHHLTMEFTAPESGDMSDLHYLMQPHHALTIAHHNEQRAEQFFLMLAKKAPAAGVRRAALEMAAEETEHVRLIAEWIKRTPAPDRDWAFDPDPPVLSD